MPLVDPVTMSDSKSSDWVNKLMGKKLGDTTDDVTFAKQDLPKEHRVISPGSMVTQDFKPDRLNVHVDEDGVVKDVKHG